MGAVVTGLRVAADKDTGVAVVTLDRPHRLNAIDLALRDELVSAWRELRFDDTVRAVVLTGAGERAFCTGLDRDTDVPQPDSPYMADDPLLHVGPKSCNLWKPVIAAVNGMACGGAFYLLGESDFLVADPAATFFDPHTTYGMVSAYESVLMAQLMPHGEAARTALMGTAERLSAERAHAIGLVTELTGPGGALTAATAAASVIAGYPAQGVQGTVRALWAAKEAAVQRGFAQAPHLVALGNLPPERQTELFRSRRPEFRLR
ncbi:enoyl-CoA hydratase/isomerase family protein [Streptomyces sp. A2-16]|uniref:enoyl-CoA hydratase/isomerase family protein n=1 Tax=Streptomyces sp. A2-16 TaxID=2781734 RepID=UPI001BAF9E61|nr:enoyl-CoA hydratase/isomerase family protein [Streptomyces sp. A2-16]QUC62636.1 enoyl-CoA hydratase/isomerase family protein [Streptomyces sp. A2-16]